MHIRHRARDDTATAVQGRVLTGRVWHAGATAPGGARDCLDMWDHVTVRSAASRPVVTL